MLWMFNRGIDVAAEEAKKQTYHQQQEAKELIPPKEYLIKSVSEFTPDMLELTKKRHQLLFVCDEMMQMHHQHWRLGDGAIKINTFPVTTEAFTMLRKDYSNGFAILPLSLQFWRIPMLPVKGELYAIPSNHLKKLDTYKQNGVVFHRTRVELKVPFERLTQQWWAKDRDTYMDAFERTHYWDDRIEAWTYIGNDLHWEEELSHFNGKHPQDYPYSDYDYRRIYCKYKKDDDGVFRKVMMHQQFICVKSFTPNSEGLEKYYFNTTYEFARTRGSKRFVRADGNNSFKKWEQQLNSGSPSV